MSTDHQHEWRLVRTHATYQIHRCRECGETQKVMGE